MKKCDLRNDFTNNDYSRSFYLKISHRKDIFHNIDHNMVMIQYSV